MNILNRLKKLEKKNPNNPPCFCDKTLVNLWYRGQGAEDLTYCRNCKDQYDVWANLSREALTGKNLTDETEI